MPMSPLPCRRMSGEDSIAKLLFMWSLSVAAPIALVASFIRWRRPPRDTRAFLWRGTVAILEMAGAWLAVALTVSPAGFFTETLHWLRVLLERDAFKAWSAIVLGSVGGLVHRLLRSASLVAQGQGAAAQRVLAVHRSTV